LITRIIKDVNTAVKEITAGNVISLPTETVYGLAGDALNPDAVLKIFEVKNRPSFNPLIVHINSIDDISVYGEEIPEELYKIAEKFSPGPITYVVKKKQIIPDIVTAGLDSVALRIPAHPLFSEVIRISGKPVAAPSANMFGRISPTNALDVLKELNGKIKFILDGGECNVGIESTVISFTEALRSGTINILRPGFITKEEIEDVSGIKINPEINSGQVIVYNNYRETDSGIIKPLEDREINLLSPGMLKNHYAPLTPLFLTDDIDYFLTNYIPAAGVINLETFGSLNNIAVNLFRVLREYDEKKYEYIVVSKVKNFGIGTAINDRLTKASAGFVRIQNNELIFIGK